MPNCHETRNGGQGPTLGCSAIDDDDDHDGSGGANYYSARFSEISVSISNNKVQIITNK
jgi:hypothetical protein